MTRCVFCGDKILESEQAIRLSALYAYPNPRFHIETGSERFVHENCPQLPNSAQWCDHSVSASAYAMVTEVTDCVCGIRNKALTLDGIHHTACIEKCRTNLIQAKYQNMIGTLLCVPPANVPQEDQGPSLKEICAEWQAEIKADDAAAKSRDERRKLLAQDPGYRYPVPAHLLPQRRYAAPARPPSPPRSILDEVD